MAEVNTTDIRVELIEHKAGRRVAELQFKIERVQQAPLELPPPPVIDTALIGRIEALGIQRREAEDLFASQDDVFLRATLALVEARVKDTSLPKVGSPAAFFRSALRDRYAAAQPKQRNGGELTQARQVSGAEPPADPAIEQARKAALKAFDSQAPDQQEGQLATFLAANPAFASFARKNPRGKIVRQALADWLRQRPEG